MTTEKLPLSDITVLELGHIVAGPFCTLTLADLGAEVIKIENPNGGDAVRDSSPTGNSSFNYVNRDKKSLTLNLKADRGHAVFIDLVKQADVIVENFGPGTTDRLNIGYTDLKEHNEQLIYCSIKGFNPGPYEDYPALDPVAEAMSGLMSMTGNPGQPPVRAGTSIADMAASLYGVISILGALLQRDTTASGQHITVPLFESTVALMGYWLAYTQAYDDIPDSLGAGHPNWSPYDVFQTQDEEWVFVGPSSERQWKWLCTEFDLPFDDDDRFATIEARRQNDDELVTLLQAEFQQFDREELVSRLRDVNVPVAPVQNLQEVVDDPHLNMTDALTEINTVEGNEKAIQVPRFPAQSTGFQQGKNRDPPQLGENTIAILTKFGYSAETIEQLASDQII
ncbi:Crotonobetainyl-CoA:carnitine CoA-transferase CaiB [Haladaptatus litoreus]|uniref:Crotonobetainyl-CoA:carnitine CoA-transferase CaiB n=1 Tax=Haladaptatus litoreus TaxID=553468 RepID=A0A1N7EKX7_9EURY|nr:CaiB/BaiF CoA-transferase family protein [Haladaptatus litoreus]SIR88605.1 Crotonobetainyl-CoA:carnitine CoA-transferase CaiB [Haladaptatus litoreus]